MTTITRRELAGLILAAPAAAMLPRALLAQAEARPNSTWGGVQVGMNAPYNFATDWQGGSARTMGVDEVLGKTLQLGISALELRSQPVELFMGAPYEALEPVRTDADRHRAAEQLRAWRLKTDPDRAAAVRKRFEAAGVAIDVVKFDGIYKFSDPEMDYAFGLAKAAGARAISCELEHEGTGRVGTFADRHKFPVAYHGHTKTPASVFEEAFAQAKFNWANIDIGHWVAGGLGNPVDMIRKHHERISHVHIKDRKKPDGETDGPNTPFGQGDTPIKDVLHLIRDNKWPIQATIEFEYAVPQGSNRLKELVKTIDYCKEALLA